ncbi:MAG: VWA domain-containing protein [Aromatoleum sp.]|jgi:Ca-activated chloride channel family protein|uniref:VWA domain-containing protein n=1 Tax=Aromatoleum sp. TaxID=2307007 RepID=UPI00289393B5|nr:VWA domain-containing protein [Aromatoleum sp.]MDT3670030.1 VWA domain-containing protein [Aromatoleum sp.]
MTFAWPWMFLLLPLPWLVRRWVPPAAADVTLRVPSADDFATATPDHEAPGAGPAPGSRSGPWLALAIWLLLVVAAARPQWIDEEAPMPVSGRDLMIAVDVSASMATRDLRLDGQPLERLLVARTLASDFIARRDGDRVGLIVFGDRAYLHTPLTFDLAAVRAALATTAVGLAGRETALGDAIALAAAKQSEPGNTDNVLILLTDGANTSGNLDPVQAAWIAARAKLRIHAVGLGAPASAPITDDGDVAASSELDEDTLRRIAEQTGGSYHRATNADALDAFYRLIGELEPVTRDASLRPARELHPWPLALALGLFAWLALRRLRRDTA